MVALTGFVVTIGVLIVQMATGTLSPRFMRLWYRDRLQKSVLGAFVGTLTFSFALLRSVEQNAVPDVGVTLAGVFVSAGLVLFLLYLDRFVHRLRPVEVAALVGHAGAEVFAAVTGPPEEVELPVAGGPRAEVASDRGGAIQALNTRALVSAATRSDCVLALRHPVGDFVTHGAPVIDVSGADPPAPETLRGLVALGRERTIEQDPAFALRIMVDVALMALSPAVNAPTTAVQVIDHIEDLPLRIGEREFAADRVLRDAAGRARVLVPGRGWADYLELGVVEIRVYGATAPQVTRRLRAALESLVDRVAPAHRPAVLEQLGELEAALSQRVADPRSRAFAWQPDRQGIGGTAPRPGFTRSG